nr:hypothetical protein [Rhodospirillales bacterium]
MSDTKGGPGSNGGESFEARLRTARQRRGLESPDGPREPSRVGGLPTSAFGIGMRVAVELA